MPLLSYGQGKVTRPIRNNTQNTSSSLKQKPLHGSSNGHEWVDLGLPSGTKWATCNIGTDKFDYYGDYYVWGNPQYVNNSTIDWNKRPQYYSKSNSYTGLSGFDPATTWGANWQTPSKANFIELIDNCIFTWTDDYDGGVWVKSKINGQQIYLPAGGGCSGTQGYDYAGIVGLYWTSSSSPRETTFPGVNDYAHCFLFLKDQSGLANPTIRTNPRQACLSIRPILVK